MEDPDTTRKVDGCGDGRMGLLDMGETRNAELHVIEDEVRAALKQHVFIPALALALTIPDAYGQIEYPGDFARNRYQRWFDNFCAFPSYLDKGEVSDILRFDGLTCYRLRCELLHSGDADIDVTDLAGMPGGEPGEYKKAGKPREADGIHTNANTSFIIRTGLSTSYGKQWVRGHESEGIYNVTIGLEQLCNALCDAAEIYKKNHFDPTGRAGEVGIQIEDCLNVSLWNPGDSQIQDSL
jgi:hypothetical protein